MAKRILSLTSGLLILLAGCAQTAQNNYQSINERVLVASQNPDALIVHYKQQLNNELNQQVNQEKTPCTRFLLAQAYFDKADFEASLFHLNIVNKINASQTIQSSLEQQTCTDDKQRFTAKVALLMAKDHYQLNQNEQALAIIERMQNLQPMPGEALNLHGVLLSEEGDYSGARYAFNLARAQLYNDTIVNNNLAILDIVEQRYQQAITKLLPLFNSKPKDKRIKANLVLAMAKNQQFQPFKALLINEYNYEEIVDLYLYLKSDHTGVTDNAMSINEVIADEK